MKDSTRLFDIILSLLLMLMFSPIFIIIGAIIKLTSKGPVIFVQKRVGRNNEDFSMYKLRTMRVNADKHGQLTVGGRDKRITKVGYYLRKLKLDEIPQLFNVFIGDMSLVGPRPEVRKYVNMYTPEQMFVLTVRPGITDYASIKYKNENELLGKAENPEEYYISVIMPHKIDLNKHYIRNKNIKNYFFTIFITIFAVFNP